MPACDLLLRDVRLADGSGDPLRACSVAVVRDVIASVDADRSWRADRILDACGLVLAPGFIDTHTHDDTSVIDTPLMLPKLTQGVTTVVVGNCGISASPVRATNPVPEPMTLLGTPDRMQYRTFAEYARVVDAAVPAVNVLALVGHTTLRANHMPRLDRAATAGEARAMRDELQQALEQGALGLSTGLAYPAAHAATLDEVLTVAEPLRTAQGLYATHMRNESDAILPAMEEAFAVAALLEDDRGGVSASCPSRATVLVSHLKCAGPRNWGRAAEILAFLDRARQRYRVYGDCYPYTASSSLLDLRQVDGYIEIRITWSTPHPEVAGRSLAAIADCWKTTQREAAERLQPAGAIYHNMSPADVQRILEHPATMVGSDGLPHDPLPHPRLWGTFPRVLGHFCREEELFDLPRAIHKMTGLPATALGLRDRGLVRKGYRADLVLFDPATIQDRATWERPTEPCVGIEKVWVNGTLSLARGVPTGKRNGRLLRRMDQEVNRMEAR